MGTSVTILYTFYNLSPPKTLLAISDGLTTTSSLELGEFISGVLVIALRNTLRPYNCQSSNARKTHTSAVHEGKIDSRVHEGKILKDMWTQFMMEKSHSNAMFVMLYFLEMVS